MRYVKFLSALAITAALTLTACGDDDDDSTSSPAAAPTTASATETTGADEAHNSADVTFLQGMIPHHEQALEMSQLAETRAVDDQVKTLARQINAAQAPEIQQMTALLQRFGAEVPASGAMDHGAMDHAGTGMMSAEQMGQLSAASGADFDRMFLQMMIEHHQGAITMAETELRDGQHPEVKQLAQQIIDTQRQEISTMSGLLSGS